MSRDPVIGQQLSGRGAHAEPSCLKARQSLLRVWPHEGQTSLELAHHMLLAANTLLLRILPQPSPSPTPPHLLLSLPVPCHTPLALLPLHAPAPSPLQCCCCCFVLSSLHYVHTAAAVLGVFAAWQCCQDIQVYSQSSRVLLLLPIRPIACSRNTNA